MALTVFYSQTPEPPKSPDYLYWLSCLTLTPGGYYLYWAFVSTLSPPRFSLHGNAGTTKPG